jgi:hypothetical protein
MLKTMQFRHPFAQLLRRSMNDQWGELTRLSFDELCTRA